jgi:hypothetical protein
LRRIWAGEAIVESIAMEGVDPPILFVVEAALAPSFPA